MCRNHVRQARSAGRLSVLSTFNALESSILDADHDSRSTARFKEQGPELVLRKTYDTVEREAASIRRWCAEKNARQLLFERIKSGYDHGKGDRLVPLVT
jgi:hypothetical protein